MSVGANWPIDVEKSHVVHAEAKIAGHRLTCLVDTGAGVSLVPKTIAEQFSPCSKPLVLEMANGDRLAALGEASLAVEIGELKTKHRFVVADIPIGVILGADFLTRNGIDILLSQHRLQWTNGSVPMEATQVKSQPKTWCYRVALTEDVVLPKTYTEMIVLADVVNDSGQPVCDLGDCLFEPDQKLSDKYGIVAAAAFVNDRSGRVPVRLLNTGGNTKLYRGKTLGRASNAMDYNHLNVLQQSQSPSHDKQNVAQDQFDWTQSSLTPTERTSLQRLLDEYSDLFSTGPGDRKNDSDDAQHFDGKQPANPTKTLSTAISC